MKEMKLYLIIIISVVMSLGACSKKNNAQPNLVEPPVVVPPPPGGTTTGFTISQSLNQATPNTDLDMWTIYSSATQAATDFKPLPTGFNDKIMSFVLPKGNMAVFAENEDGTGESICYVAVTSDIKENLPARLVGKVSYVRMVPFRNLSKRGMCQTNFNDVQALQGSWYYNWGLNSVSIPTIQAVPMNWSSHGAYSGSITAALNLVGRRDIDHLLSFNEPDGAKQANMPDIDDAVTRYQFMLKPGLRMCSPAVTQDNATGDTRWLQQFMTAADAAKARVDVIALHWYDWGNETNNKSTDQLNADAILSRFKAYINRVHTAYPNQALWFTEYNCNPARNEAVHLLFMKSSTEYLNSLSYVERYAYFFPGVLPATSGTPNYTLTAMGKTWSEISSPSSLTANVIPK
jgi:hypothetical protein